MSHDCDGCKCHKKVFMKLDKEKRTCKYTQIQYDHIPGCPCKECLVKVTCNTLCDDVVYMLKHRLEIREPYRSYMTGGRKDIGDGAGVSSCSWGSISSGSIRTIRSNNSRYNYTSNPIKAKRRP